MKNITNAELTQMKARLGEAGDYEVDVKGVGGYAVMTVEDVQFLAEFIAHAREDVPRLVAEVERLQHEVGEHSAHNGHLITAEIIPLSRENKRLKAEVERLRKADEKTGAFINGLLNRIHRLEEQIYDSRTEEYE